MKDARIEARWSTWTTSARNNKLAPAHKKIGNYRVTRMLMSVISAVSRPVSPVSNDYPIRAKTTHDDHPLLATVADCLLVPHKHFMIKRGLAFATISLALVAFLYQSIYSSKQQPTPYSKPMAAISRSVVKKVLAIEQAEVGFITLSRT